MANEAVLIMERSPPINFTVADGTGIEKGAILKLTDPMTAALADGDDDVVAGIAAEEKIANDGKTKLAVYTDGIFRVLAGGAIALGDLVKTNASTGASNEVITIAAVANTTEEVVGRCLETVADTNTFLLELRPWKQEWPA